MKRRIGFLMLVILVLAGCSSNDNKDKALTNGSEQKLFTTSVEADKVQEIAKNATPTKYGIQYYWDEQSKYLATSNNSLVLYDEDFKLEKTLFSEKSKNAYGLSVLATDTQNIYFSLSESDQSSLSSIYRYEYKTKNTTKIVSKVFIKVDENSFIFNEKLYYLANDKDGSVNTTKLTSYDLKTGKIDSILSASKAVLYNDQIYFIEKNELYTYDQKTKKGRLYYQDNKVTELFVIDMSILSIVEAKEDKDDLKKGEHYLYNLETQNYQLLDSAVNYCQSNGKLVSTCVLNDDNIFLNSDGQWVLYNSQDYTWITNIKNSDLVLLVVTKEKGKQSYFFQKANEFMK